MPGIEDTIAVVVEAAVRRAVAPHEAEIAKLRGESDADGVTIPEAARRLSLSQRTVERRVRDGTLPSIKVGRARRVKMGTIFPEDA